MSKSKNESLENYIYEEIQSAILKRKIPLDTHLSEEQLAEAFNVSRTPIRSVLKRLNYEKTIRFIPNKGAFINNPSEKEMADVFQLREIIEIQAVKFACRNASMEQLEELESLTYLEEKLYREDQYDKAIQITSEFHYRLICLVGNELMKEYSKELINISNIHLAYHDHADKESPRCPNEHREIIKAIRKGDEEDAIRVFLEHFKTVKSHLALNSNNKQNISFKDIFEPYQKSN
ncbi:GntR family transcriptional regulator [Neobacillus sp. 19]|uniref:GntR family transcriptional regulator n=1 Tax=Neobacillus sp. 19 TaxID=3394458 RepID=UPI003BF63153